MSAGADLPKGGQKTGANLRTESMKKAIEARKPSKAKAPTQKGKGHINPILDLLENMDEDLIGMLRQTVQKLSSLLACFPAEARIMLLSELVAGKKAVIDQAVAGFLLHPDAVLAQSVAEALATSATQTPVESSLIERLVRMRTWLSQTRQTQLDTTIRLMRLNALPPVKPELPSQFSQPE
jgi:hypothetical protein